MTTPAVGRLFDAFAAGGVTARFVGGCVRDALIGRPVKDVDIATPELPERVMAVLRDAGIQAVPTGLKHGTVTALIDRQPFEITTLRRDVETDGRHAVVAFTDDWAADAARRDFTMNALYCDPDGTLHDPTGGLADLQAGRVRFVGDGGRRIEEDVLRLLRFFRFHAHYGAGPPDQQALEACRAMVDRLPQLSAERVRHEVLRLLEADRAAEVWAVMTTIGAVARVVPDATEVSRLTGLVPIEMALGRIDPVRRLGALVVDQPAAAIAVARQLKLTNREKARLVAMKDRIRLPIADRPRLDLDEAAIFRVAHYLGSEALTDRLLLIAADAGASPDGVNVLLAALEAWEPPTLPIGGDDVLALGVPKGPRIRELLSMVEAWWVARDFAPDRDQCLAELARQAKR